MGRISTPLVGVLTEVDQTLSQALTAAVDVALIFDSVTRDDLAAWSAATPTRLRAPVNRSYLLSGFFHRSANTNPKVQVAIRINGVTTIARKTLWANNNENSPWMAISRALKMVAGDYAELIVNTGGTARSSLEGHFSMLIVG